MTSQKQSILIDNEHNFPSQRIQLDLIFQNELGDTMKTKIL